MPQITVDGLVPDGVEDDVIDTSTWAIAGGSPDVIEVAYPTPVTAFIDGMELKFRASDTTLTTTPTFSPDGLPPHTIVKNSGALAVGDIVDDGEYTVRYQLANTRWMLLNPGAL